MHDRATEKEKQRERERVREGERAREKDIQREGYIYIYRVFIVICQKINAFFGQKIYFLKPKFFFLKCWKINIYECLKKFHERPKFMAEKASYFRCLKSSIQFQGGGGGRGGFDVTMRSQGFVKLFLKVENYFFLWKLILVYISQV